MLSFRGLLLSVLLAFFLIPAGLSAQVTVGFGGGLASSTFTGDDIDDDDVDSKTGLLVSGWLAIPLGDRLAVVPGASYVQKGANDNDPSVDAEFSVDYLEIPVLLLVTLTNEDTPVRVGLFGGPTFAFEVSCDVEGSSGGVTISLSCEDAGLESESFDFGVGLGASLSYPVKDNLSIWGNGGLDLGLRKLDASAEEDDVKNRAFFLQAGVSFVVGG